MIPKVEQGPECHPSEAEVLEQFEKILEDREFTEIKKVFDESGLFEWEIRIDNGDGSTTEYLYGRQADHGAPNSLGRRRVRQETQIEVAYFDADGIPEGGNSVAKYQDGEWVDTTS